MGWACLRGSRAPLGAPEAPSAPRTRASRPARPPRARRRCAAFPAIAAGSRLTTVPLGRQVADILDGADVDDVDAAVLGRERRVLSLTLIAAACAPGRRAARPPHSPAPAASASGQCTGRAGSQGAGPPGARPPPASPGPGPAPAPRAAVQERPPCGSRAGSGLDALPASFAFKKDTSAVRCLCPGGGHAGQIFR